MNQIARDLSEEQETMLEHRTGLRLSTYFSALKIRWLIDSVPEVKEAVEANRCMFGTVDSWFLWVSVAISQKYTPLLIFSTESLTTYCPYY